MTKEQIKELAEKVYDEMDELAREVDSYDFGLPAFKGREKVIAPLLAALASYAEEAPPRIEEMGSQVTGKSAGAWVKVGQLFPENWPHVIMREIHSKRIIVESEIESEEMEYFIMTDGTTIGYGECEWLDESGEAGKQPQQQEINPYFKETLEKEPFNLIRNLILRHLTKYDITALKDWLTREE